MIAPLVKLDLREFNRDLRDRINRSKRGAVEIINQTALDVAFKALKACPKSESPEISELKRTYVREVRFRNGEHVVGWKSSKIRDVIVGRYYNKHGSSVRGFNFDGLPDAIMRMVQARTAGRWFLKSRFARGIDALNKALGKQKNIGPAKRNLNDEYSYGSAAKNQIMTKARAIIFASHQYAGKTGVKKITENGRRKLDKAANDGLLAVQNGWRDYANRVLGKAFNKTN